MSVTLKLPNCTCISHLCEVETLHHSCVQYVWFAKYESAFPVPACLQKNKNSKKASSPSLKRLAFLPHLTCQSQLPPTASLFLFFQRFRGRRRSSTASNGLPGNANLFLGNTNLPDLVQQSTSPLVSPGDASGAQVGRAASRYRPLNLPPSPDPERLSPQLPAHLPANPNIWC